MNRLLAHGSCHVVALITPMCLGEQDGWEPGPTASEISRRSTSENHIVFLRWGSSGDVSSNSEYEPVADAAPNAPGTALQLQDVPGNR